MTTDSTPTEQGAASAPDLPPQREGATRKRPVGWIILAVLAIAAVGLGVWALLLNDDLNDTEEQPRSPDRCGESASAEAESRIADARPASRRRSPTSPASWSSATRTWPRRRKPPPKPSRAWQMPRQQRPRRKAKSSRRAPSATWRAPRRNGDAEAAQAELCADASLAATRSWPRATTRPTATRRLHQAQRRPRAPARELNGLVHSRRGFRVALDQVPQVEGPLSAMFHGGLRVSSPRTAKEVVLGMGGSIAGTVYGTIVVMAVIAAGSRGEDTNPWQLMTLVTATVLVLWVAHVYAHALSDSLVAGRRAGWSCAGLRGAKASIPSPPLRPSARWRSGPSR